MKKCAQPIRTIAGVLAVSLMARTASYGLGFRNPDQDARATGQGEAFVAQADDASAIYYNPGGLTQVKGTQVTSGGYFYFPTIRLNQSTGGTVSPKDDMAFLPQIYLATDFGLEKWRFGLGFNIPFGNSIDWGASSPFTLTKNSLTVYNIEPTVAYQLNEHLSFGVGLNVYHGDTSVEDNLPAAYGGGHFKFDGSGEAFGATVGLLWKIDPHNTIGIVYRSPFAIGFSGDATLKGNVAGLNNHSQANATIEFPQSVAVGYALRPVKRLKLEVDVEWTNWDTLNTVGLRSPNPVFDVNTDPSLVATVFNWKDSCFYEFGAQYDLAKHWVVRGGYIFSENTIPSATLSPSVPDSNRHVFSAGVGYAATQFSVDAVYQYSLSTDRTIPMDGTWSSSSHALLITSTLKF